MVYNLVTRSDVPISQQFGVNPLVYSHFGIPGHNGLDLAVPVGTELFALADALVVELAFDTGGYGLYLKLRIAQADWIYAHLSDTGATVVGDKVVAGTPIARSGTTGFSTGPHLHLGYRPWFAFRDTPYNGYVDPEPELQLLTTVGSP